MTNFEGFDLHATLQKSLKKMGYETPTPIQEKSIPVALKGNDIMGSAQTGTGKTAAFSIPLVQSMLTSSEGCGLVMTPTRELGKQVMEIIKQLLGYKNNIGVAFLIGGEPISRQIKTLKQNPRIIVGTPGRINDHLERRTLRLNDCKFLVLDETDRMLDMGFSAQIDRIVDQMPGKGQRQTMLFSATLPKNIIALSDKYLSKPVRVAVGSTRVPMENIKQAMIRVDSKSKYPELLRQLEARDGASIIFVKTKHGTERLAKRLNSKGYNADAIHGDLKQSRRTRVIKAFREKKFNILVATDVVARGLDIPHIRHVINYDLPQVAEDYIHRIGRTARAGKTGEALSLVSDQDGRKWRDIERLIDPNQSEPDSQGGNRSNNSRGSKKPRRSFRDNEDRKFSNRGGKFKKGGKNGKPFAKKSKKPKKTFDGSDESKVSVKPIKGKRNTQGGKNRWSTKKKDAAKKTRKENLKREQQRKRDAA